MRERGERDRERERGRGEEKRRGQKEPLGYFGELN